VHEEYRAFAVPEAHPVRRQLQAAWDFYLAIGSELPIESPSTERITHIVFSGFVRCARLYRCVLALVADGFGPEAEAMTRGMYEATVVAYWAMTHPAEAVERFDLHLDYSFYLNSRAGPPPDSATEAFEMEPARLEAARKTFGRYGERPWHGRKLVDLDRDFMAMFASIDTPPRMLGYFEGLHRWLNWSVHGSPTSLFRGVSHDEQRRSFVVAPADFDLGDALANAADQMLLATILRCMAASEPYPRALEERAFEIWRSRTPAAYTAGRNDACPCGSGKKYKACHLFR
jgi:hypothetical protein